MRTSWPWWAIRSCGSCSSFLCTLCLLHAAHRFRYTLYDGLQLQHLQELILLVSYGGAIVGSVAAGVLLWQFG